MAVIEGACCKVCQRCAIFGEMCVAQFRVSNQPNGYVAGLWEETTEIQSPQKVLELNLQPACVH